MKWIKELNLELDINIIDVGGGVSTLVDDLLDRGYQSITVVDISNTALGLAQGRLGEKAKLVTWLNEDITSVQLTERHFDLWHDRALFHFLIAPEQQQQYCDNLLTALKPGGHLIMATFSPEAPPRCSGLPVERFSAEKLASVLGVGFELKRHVQEMHVTPGGVEQMYLYCHFQKIT